MKMLCILNPVAGGGRVARQAMALLDSMRGWADMSVEIALTEKQGDGTRFARKAAQEGYGIIAAAGGDGTINEVATGLIGRDAILAIIPLGSGNGLARALGIPLKYQEACRLLMEGKPRKIDVGQVEGRNFFATSGIGFDAHVGKVYNETPGNARGITPYVQIAVSEFFNYTPENVILRCNGKTYCYTPLVLTVANTEQYGGGAIIAPGVRPDDGLFDVVVIPRSHVLTLVTQIPKLFSGELNTFPHSKTHRASSLTITRNFPGPAHVDGESFMAGEVLQYTMLHEALNVLVPSSKKS